MIYRAKSLQQGRLIDLGWEYTVFESPENEDRVVKYEHPIPAGEALAFARNCDSLLTGSLPSRIRRFDDPEDNYSQALDYGAMSDMFGNPKFEGNYWTQDRVRPLKHEYSKFDEEARNSIMDKWSNFLEDCLEVGFYDESWSFHQNTGFNDEDEMVQIDLGELKFSTEQFKKDVQNEVYRNRAFYGIDLHRKTSSTLTQT
jgi:hypothetical protein